MKAATKSKKTFCAKCLTVKLPEGICYCTRYTLATPTPTNAPATAGKVVRK